MSTCQYLPDEHMRLYDENNVNADETNGITAAASLVLDSIDRLRRDLSGYHGQLKAHNDLQTHCDRQRERIAALEALHKRDMELQTENAKLQEERDHWHIEQVHAYGNWEDANKRDIELEAENAKLRELVKDAWSSGHPDRSCGECGIQDECHAEIERMHRHGNLRYARCLFERRIEERMHELGIEVSE